MYAEKPEHNLNRGGESIATVAKRWWPTPSATSYGTNQGGAAGRTGKVRPSLDTMVRDVMWSTPTTRDWKDGACADANVPTNGLLGRQTARWWPTPTVGDSKASGAAGYQTETRHVGTTLTDAAVAPRGPLAQTTPPAGETISPSTPTAPRRLNPRFVEALMGWPSGWARPEPMSSDSSATELFPPKPNAPSLSSTNVSKITVDASNPQEHPPAVTTSLVLQDAHAARRLKVLNSTSASAIDRWEQCERQWFGSYVEGVQTESSDAQKRGTAIDLEVQHHYRAEPVNPGWADAVRGIVALLPPAPRIQHKIAVPTYDGGPVLIGYPDFLDEVAPGDALVLDLKSLSDFKYAKTAAELLDNTQMVTYASWLWTLPGVEYVRAGHVAARFKRDHDHPVGYKFTGARLSELAEMERGRTLDLWGSKLGLVQTMVSAAKSAVRFEDLAPTGAAKMDKFGKTSCESFQGCHFRGRCGFAVSMQVSKTFNNGATMSNGQPSLMEQLEAMKNTGGLQAPPQQQMLSVPGNGGMVVGGGGPPGAFPPPPQAGPHAHPGALGLAGYVLGQPCNGRGYYANQAGSGGFIPVESGHMCAACVGPATINPSQVLPPDAPVRTSTPAEIQAVVEGKKGRGKGKTKPSTADAATIEDFVKLQGLGFTTQEITDVQRQGILADALSGKITPGMMRQPRSAPPAPVVVAQLPAPPQSPPPVANMILPGEVSHHDPGDGTHAVASPQALAAAQAGWYAASGPPQPAPANVPPRTPIPATPPTMPGHDVSQQYGAWVAVPSQIPVGVASPPPSTAAPSAGGFGEHPAHAMIREQAQQQTLSAVLPPGASYHEAVVSPRPPTGLVLLIDCVPAKGLPAALLADWLSPVLDYACSQVLDDNGRSAPVADLRLVPYARGKGYLGAAVRLALGTVPPVLSIDTSQYGADVVIEALTPWAPTIIVPGPGRR